MDLCVEVLRYVARDMTKFSCDGFEMSGSLFYVPDLPHAKSIAR